MPTQRLTEAATLPAITNVAERRERGAEVVLRCCPLERRALAGPFLERVAVGLDGFEQTLGAVLALPERQERGAEVVLRHGPVERHALADVAAGHCPASTCD
jgi:hypothetical protein